MNEANRAELERIYLLEGHCHGPTIRTVEGVASCFYGLCSWSKERSWDQDMKTLRAEHQEAPL